MERPHGTRMESSFPSDYFNLAQIPTDQREDDFQYSVKTQSLDVGPFQMNASQPYNPWHSGSENWAVFRSNLVSESMAPFQHPGCSSPLWCATSLEPHECSPKSCTIGPKLSQPENFHLCSLYSTPHPSTISIGLLRDSMAQSTFRISRVPHGDDLLDWPSDPTTSLYLARDSNYRHPAQLETFEGYSPALRRTPPSPPISISSQQSSSSMSINSLGPTASNTVADSSSPRASLGDQSEGDHNAEPYSKLIYRALNEADDHRLSLQQIYDWFIKNTSKGRDNSKGWQNSIRHNLSMNKGFEASKIEGCTRKKPQNLWALTQDAIDRGNVESTTRYRKSNHRKATSSSSAYLGRQRSGSKGGKAAKHAVRTRHQIQREQDREQQFPSPTQSQTQLPQPQPSGDLASSLPRPPLGGAPLYQLEPVFNGLPPHESPVKQEFDYSKVIGCTSSPIGDHSIFYDVAGPAPSYGPLDLDHIGGWYPFSGPDNGLIAGPKRR